MRKNVIKEYKTIKSYHKDRIKMEKKGYIVVDSTQGKKRLKASKVVAFGVFSLLENRNRITVTYRKKTE